MIQLCLLWKMKVCRVLHTPGMFSLMTLSELCRMLHTLGISSLKTLRELCRFYTLLVCDENLDLGLFFQDQKNQMVWPLFVELAIIRCQPDAFHMEIMSEFHIFYVIFVIMMFCRSRVQMPDLTAWSFYWSQVWFPSPVTGFRPVDVAYVRQG